MWKAGENEEKTQECRKKKKRLGNICLEIVNARLERIKETSQDRNEEQVSSGFPLTNTMRREQRKHMDNTQQHAPSLTCENMLNKPFSVL